MSLKNFAFAVVVSFASVLFSCGGASSADFPLPTQKVEGAENPIPLGDIVFLSLSEIANKPDGYVSYNADWKIFSLNNDGTLVEKKYRKMADGSVFFGSGVVNAKYKVFVSVSYLYVLKDKDGKYLESGVRSALLVVDLVIGEDKPLPPPEPKPDVDPTFPDGKFKLAATAYKLAKDKVEPKNKIAAGKLANSFSTMAAKIAAGQELATAEDIKRVLRETTASNRDALKDAGLDNATWDAFFIGLQDVIYDLYSNGKLTKKEDFVVAWKELSEGLKAIK